MPVSGWQSPAALGFLAGAGLVGAAAYLNAYWSINSSRTSPEGDNIIPSPLFSVLPTLSDADLAQLAYPPDALPGARDVASPFGSIRVYEWGPEDGRKVLFVHGISTPCISLGQLAQRLVEKGCRVMLFDLFGRGYSSGPSDLHYDIRLYTSQILLVLASSEIAWKRFSVVGYSLGGGISAVFTSYFPYLVESLVLIAPGGLVRAKHFSWRSKLMYSTGIFPEWLLTRIVKGRLTGGNSQPEEDSNDATKKKDPDEAIKAEVPNSDINSRVERPGATFNVVSLSASRRNINIAHVVSWQLLKHAGFVNAFMSSIRYAPIHSQQHHYRRIGQGISGRDGTNGRSGISGSLLLIPGESDPIVIKDEIVEDMLKAVGTANMQVKVVDAGHELPITRSEEVADAICALWE